MALQTIEQIKVVNKADEPRIKEKVYTFSKINNEKVKIRKVEKKVGTESERMSAQVPEKIRSELEEKGFEVVA